MKGMLKKQSVLALSILLIGCGSMSVPDINLPMLNGDYRELSLAPKDAIEYQCEKNRHFYVKVLEGGKEMWLIYSDREFGLKQVESSKNVYTNDATTLEINDPETFIKEGDVLAYQKCQPKKLK